MFNLDMSLTSVQLDADCGPQHVMLGAADGLFVCVVIVLLTG